MNFCSRKPEQPRKTGHQAAKRLACFPLPLFLPFILLFIFACNSKAKVQWESTERSAVQDKINTIIGNGELATLYRNLSAQLSEDERKPLNTLVSIIIDRTPSKADKNATLLSALKAIDSIRGFETLRPRLKENIELMVESAKVFDRALKPIADGVISANAVKKTSLLEFAQQLGRTASNDTNLMATIESGLPSLRGDSVVNSSEAWSKLPTEPSLANTFLSTLLKVAQVANSEDTATFITRALDTTRQSKVFEGLRGLSAGDPQLGSFVRLQNASAIDSLDSFTRLMTAYGSSTIPENSRAALTDALKKALVLKPSLLSTFLTTVEKTLNTSDAIFNLNALINSIDRSGGEGYYTQPQFTSKSLSALTIPQCRLPGNSTEKMTFSFRWSKSGNTLVDWTLPSASRQNSAGQLFALNTTAQCSVRIFLDGTKIAELSTDLVTVRSMPPTFNSGDPPVSDSFALKKGETLTYVVSQRDPVADLNTFYRITEQPKNGVLSQPEIGTFEYKPLATYTGADAFKFVACNPDDMCSSDKVISLAISDGDRSPKLERMVVPSWNSVAGGIRMSRSTDLNNIKLIVNDEENINASCGTPNVFVTADNPGRFQTIELSGTYPNCNLRIKPKFDASSLGTTTMTLKLDDQVNPQVTSTFVVTVVDGAPQWANSAAPLSYTVNKNSTGNTIQLDTASDPDASLFPTPESLTYVIESGPTAGSLTGVSSVPTAGVGTVTFAAPSGQGNTQANQTASFAYKVCDNALPQNCTSPKTVNINIINNAPSISEIATQTINEESNTGSLSFTIADADDNRTCVQVSKSSSNTNLVPTENINVSGTAPTCTVTVTPVANGNGGPVTITLGLAHSTPVQRIFSVNVTPVNDSPTLSATGSNPLAASVTGNMNYAYEHAALNINEDATATNITLMKGEDPDTTGNINAAPQTLTYHLVAAPTKGTLSSGNTLGVMNGLADPLTGATLTYTPNPNQNGNDSFIYKVCDSSGPPSQTTCSANVKFNVAITAVPDAPTISEIPNQQITEGQDTGPLQFNITDPDGLFDCTSNNSLNGVTATSNNTDLIPNNNIILAGANQNCTVKAIPVAEGNGGPVTITLGLTHSPPVQRSFIVNVTPVNDTPTIDVTNADPTATAASGTVPATTFQYTHSHDQLIISEDPASAPSNNITLVKGVDIDASDTSQANGSPQKLFYFLEKAPIRGTLSTGNAVGFMNVASNTNPLNGLQITYTPKPNENGSDYFLYKICDSLMACTGLIYVPISITAQNDNPTFTSTGDLFKDVEVDSTVTITLGSASDIDSIVGAAGSANPLPQLVSAPTQGVLTNTGSGTQLAATNPLTATVEYSPAAGQYGVFSFSYRYCDASNACTETRTVTLNVIGKRISRIADQQIQEDTSTGKLPFSLLGFDNTFSCTGADPNRTVSAISADQSKIPNANLAVEGSGQECTIQVTPAQNAHGGPVQITLSIGGITKSFNVTVSPVNDVPLISQQGDTSIQVSEAGTININLATANDADGQTPTPRLVTAPAEGTLQNSPAIGATLQSPIAYTPAAGKTGVFNFVYRLCSNPEGSDCTADQHVRIEVLGKNPVFNNAAATGVYNISDTASATTIALDGATDPDAGLLSQTLSYRLTLTNDLVTLGTASIVPTNGTGGVTITPKGTSGVEILTYEICDEPTGGNCTALPKKTVTINIGSVTYPVLTSAGTSSVTTPTNTPATVNLGAFVDPTNAATALEYEFTQNPGNRVSSPSALDAKQSGNQVTYTPTNDGTTGSENLAYRACTKNVSPRRCSVEYSVVLNRSSVYNIPSLVGGDSLVILNETAGGGGSISINLATAVANPEGRSLSYKLTQLPQTQTGKARTDGIALGTLSNAAGNYTSANAVLASANPRSSGSTLTYTLNSDVRAGFADQIAYQVCQVDYPALCSETKTVAIAVIAQDDPTTLTGLVLDSETPPLKLSGAAQGSQSFNLLFNLADSDSTVSCSAVTVQSKNTAIFAVPTVAGDTTTSCSMTLVSSAGESGDSDISFLINSAAIKINGTNETSFRATALALDGNNKAIHICDNASVSVSRRPQGVAATINGAAQCKDTVASGWDPSASLDPTKLFRAVDTSKLPDPRRYCTGIKLFGYQGMALCGDGTEPLQLHRNVGTLLLNSSTAPSSNDYRLFPDPSKDHDAQTVGSSGVVKLATRPNVVCGTGSTVAARIADCANANGAFSYWDGSAKGHGGQGLWRLVTVKPISGADCTSGCAEIWRDERTGLLWSDVVVDSSATPVDSYNWCKASGSSNAAEAPGAEDDPSDICDNATHQGQNSDPSPKPTSLCAEDAAFLPRDARQKLSLGDLDLQSTPKIRWWLPSRSDYLRAERNGLRFVLPNISNAFWTATVNSKTPAHAWVFHGQAGGKLTSAARNTVNKVRCVGSP